MQVSSARRPSDQPPRLREHVSTRRKCGRCRDHPACAGSTCRTPTESRTWTDHPLRVRGPRPPCRVSRRLLRITPARAGNNIVCSTVEISKAGSPRAYEEHLNLQFKRRHQIGLPPCVQGAQQYRQWHRANIIGLLRGGAGARIRVPRPVTAVRITPACARSTTTNYIVPSGNDGSPPRMRGARTGEQLGASGIRITPARTGEHLMGPKSACLSRHRITRVCTGSTFTCGSSGGIRSGHPRVCREYNAAFHKYIVVFGASPPGRGALLVGYRDVLTPRITPACTGSTPKSVGPPCR